MALDGNVRWGHGLIGKAGRRGGIGGQSQRNGHRSGTGAPHCSVAGDAATSLASHRHAGDWKRAGALEQLLIQRALRPDRQAQATAQFVSASLGPEYVQGRAWGLEEAGQAGGPCVPMLLFLSQGVDVAGMVEAYAGAHGRAKAAGSFDSVSMGQGQVRAC